MAGQLWLWGSNAYGQLGDNTTTSKSSPVQTVTGGTNWKFLTSAANGYGGSNTFGIKTDGTLWCWGRNYFGGLGDNTSTSRSSPVQIFGGGTWTAISAGYHTAGIKSDGTLWCWGQGSNGQLGDNTNVTKSSPIQTVTGGNNWTSVACGTFSTSAIKTDGTLWIWGYNTYGQLGDNTTASKSSPIQTIAGGTNWSSVACGYFHTAATKTDGTLWTWGLNNAGQLGDNTIIHRSSPVQVFGFATNWSSVACGGNNTAAIKKDGTLWTWGVNTFGQLGDNTLTHKSSPIQTVAFGTNWSRVSNKLLYTTATKADGTIWAWGYNNYGQLGDNTTTNRSSPVQTVMAGTRWSFVTNAYTTAAIYENTPSTLSIATQPANAYTGQRLLNQPIINVVDSSGAIVQTPPITVTVALASGSPTLTGTTNIISSGGVVSYSDLSLTGIGSGSLIFTASGLTSAISSYVAVEQSSIAIVPKRTETSGRIPDPTQLRNGELAINIADKKGYVKNSSGAIVNVFTGLGDSTITSGMVAENAINMREIAPGAVGPSELASGVIGGSNSQILYNSSGAIIGTAALTLSTTSGVVTIAPQNAGYNALTLRSYTSQTADLLKVQNSAGTDIARVTSSGEWVGPLGSGNIVSGYIASGQIGINHLASGVISTAVLGSGQVTSGAIASGQIGAYHFGAGTLTSGYALITNGGGTLSWAAAGSALTSGQVTSGLLGNNTVVSGSIASGQIFTLHIASGGLLSGAIGSGQIGNFHLSSGAVTSGEIGNAAVVSGSIASGAVGAYHFNATGIASGFNLRTDGTGILSWATGGGGGLTVSDDTSTNATRYLTFTSATTGSVSTINVSSTKLSFNPSTGDFTAGGNITANSDARIKTNIKTIENALDKVKSLRGVSFERKDSGIKNIGVIAQEVEAIVPELVRESDGLKSVAYGNIVALLIEAIKEQSKKIEELEKLCQSISNPS